MQKSLPHILMIASWYPTPEKPFLGNFVERHIQLIATHYQVTVLHLQSSRNIKEISLRSRTTGNLREILVDYPASVNPLIKYKNAQKAFKKGIENISEVDLIHGHVILSKGLQFLWAKKHFKKPLIVTEHASYFRKEILQSRSFKDRLILRKVIKAAATVTAVSDFHQQEINSLFPAIKIDILPNVIDDQLFNFQKKDKNSKPCFVHISTLDEQFKNISGIIAACQQLHATIGNNFLLKIISDEPSEKWQHIVHELNLNDCISFYGPLHPKDIAEILHKADALVLFSNYETFSIVVAESWATGTPVISTPVGIAINLPKKLGIQIATGNVQELTNAMRTVIDNDTSFDTSSMMEKAQQYTEKKVLEKINEIYHRFI